jgi:hypothetical protein
MLPRILRREWILHRQVVMIMFAIFGAYQVFALMSMDSARAWIVFAALYASFLTAVLFIREDKFRATSWTCILPIKRIELVRARFIASWAMLVAALGGATLLAAVLPGTKFPASEIFDTSTLLIVATLTTLVFAWVLPFSIRFGMAGIMVFLVGAQLAGVLLLLIGSRINRTSGNAGRPIRTALAAISDTLVSAREALSPTLFVVVVIVALVATNWLAYRFAAFLFDRREL